MTRFALLLLLALPIQAATGPEVPELVAFDQEIIALMERWNVPGGSIAISRNGRLVLARGYGMADREAGIAVQPWSQFRIASVSKPVTTVAILTLFERGRLDLDDHAADHLRSLLPPSGPSDPRVEQITIRDLLRHSGGWDAQQIGVDIQFTPHEIARTYGVALPPGAERVAAYALDQPLQADPATRFAYANVGFTILGRIIERSTGLAYEDFVREEVLAPIGIRCMRIGSTFPADAARGEVRYYEPLGAERAPSILDESVLVPWPYGGFDMRALDAAGGWIASPAELLRLVDSIDLVGSDSLRSDTLQKMIERPPYEPAGAAYYYALGWLIQRGGIWWHTGGLPGTASYLLRIPGGINIFVVFNSLPSTDFYADLDAALGAALQSVSAWPEGDLYGSVAACPGRRRAVKAQ